MNKPKRYISKMHWWQTETYEHPNGQFVLNVDYEALDRENEQLKKDVEMWKLRSENWQKYCQLTRPDLLDVHDFAMSQKRIRELEQESSIFEKCCEHQKNQIQSLKERIKIYEDEIGALKINLQSKGWGPCC